MAADNKNFLKYLSLITEVGLSIVVSTLCGLFAGLYLDRIMGIKGPFTITLLICGVIGGFIAAYKLVSSPGDKK